MSMTPRSDGGLALAPLAQTALGSTLAASFAERTGASERLRGKLVEVGERFLGFDNVMETDTARRHEEQNLRTKDLEEALIKVERAMASEIKRRVEASKFLESRTELIAQDMYERVQAKVRSRITQIASEVAGLHGRCASLEQGIQQFHGDMPSKLQVDTAELIREIAELRKSMDGDFKRCGAVDESGRKRCDHILDLAETRMGREDVFFEEGFAKLRREADLLLHATHTREVASASSFQAFILEEIAALKRALGNEGKVRQQTDDEVVQAIHHYTNSLQRGMRFANQRG